MNNERIELAHGSGGKLTQQLIQTIMVPAFQNSMLQELHDGAKIAVNSTKLAFTTDSYVVKPRFFPGGNIGKLAVCGTVNDLAATGAVPRYLSAGFIIEEGFGLIELKKIVTAMAEAAVEAGVAVVTGDTKVVEKGAVDGIIINTAGVGEVLAESDIAAANVKPGQRIIITGSLGEHAVAVMSERYGLKLPQTVVSDCAPLNGMIARLLTTVPGIVMLRDVTRGGLATTLNEIAVQAAVGVVVDEGQLVVKPPVQAVCEILGFDPLYLANEGKMLVFVEKEYVSEALHILRQHRYGLEAQVIGEVVKEHRGQVALRTIVGGLRLLDMLTGEQMPRIC